jgi:hypothetical protein
MKEGRNCLPKMFAHIVVLKAESPSPNILRGCEIYGGNICDKKQKILQKKPPFWRINGSSVLSVTLHFVPFHFVPGHFVPVTLSPGHFVPSHFVPGHFVPWSLCPPVTLSPGHYVPWSLCHRSFCPQSLNPLYSIFGMT